MESHILLHFALLIGWFISVISVEGQSTLVTSSESEPRPVLAKRQTLNTDTLLYDQTKAKFTNVITLPVATVGMDFSYSVKDGSDLVGGKWNISINVFKASDYTLCDKSYTSPACLRGLCSLYYFVGYSSGIIGSSVSAKSYSTCLLNSNTNYVLAAVVHSTTLPPNVFGLEIQWTARSYCQPGYQLTATGDCEVCQEGTFNPNSNDTCRYCQVGTRSGSTKASTFCLDCQAGQYSTVTRTSCESCPLGYYSMAKSSSCTMECEKGFYNTRKLGATTPCVTCPIGYSTESTASSKCSSCPRGYIRNTTTQLCLPCEPGTFGPLGAVECMDCPPGQYAEAGSDTCQYCTAGTYSNKGKSKECIPCPFGQSSQQGATQCATTSSTLAYSVCGSLLFITICGLVFYYYRQLKRRKQAAASIQTPSANEAPLHIQTRVNPPVT